MTNFSFTSFLSRNGGASTSGTSARALSKPSDKQIKYYTDLCERKRVQPKDINAFTFDQLGKEIEELNKRPDPASTRQIEKIRELEKEIIAHGGDLQPLTDEFINGLTGGREGTASSFIQTLFDMRSKLNDVAPPSDAQLQIMVEWYLCPDIPFESFSSEEIYPMNPGANLNESQTVTIEIPRRVEMENGLWRHMTAQEFADAIKAKITKKQASKFIDEYRGVFYDWRKTRITAQQMSYIRELELRLANISSPKAVEFAIVEGQIQQITQSADLNADWNPIAYTPMEELALAQMSFEEASEWIDQLKSEVNSMNRMKEAYDENGEYNYSEIYGRTQQQFEEKNLVRGQNNRVRDEVDARNDEFNKLNDLIFSLEAILGYEDQEAHDCVQDILMNDDITSTRKTQCIEHLNEFFLSTVTANPEKNEKAWTSQMARIYNMCEEIPVALEILAYQKN